MVNNSYLRKAERILFFVLVSIATLLTFGLPAAKAKAEANDLLLSDERYRAQIAVLREMTDNTFTAVSVKELRGTGGEPEFLAIEGSPGYAVYSETDDAVLEFSADAPSPYDGLAGDNLYYFGDGAYYVLEGNEFLHLTTGQTLQIADAEATLGAILNDAVETQSSGGYTYVTELTFTDVSISSFSGATNSPFYKMRSATEFGRNLYGTCTGVAANMLMQYYSDQYCPGFLPCSDADFTSLGWRGSEEVSVNGQIVNAYYATGDSVAEKRHKYIYNRITTRIGGYYYNGADLYQTRAGMAEVLREANRTSWTVNTDGDNSNEISDNTKNNLISRLSSGPVIASIFTASGTIEGSPIYDEKHACIFYGATTVGGRTYFLAHMGHESVNWGSSTTQLLYATIIPKEYVRDIYVYMTPPSAASSHSYTVTSTANGYHTMQCSNCVYRGNAFTTTHPSVCNSAGDSQHVTQCKYNYCSYNAIEVHSLKYTDLGKRAHKRRCSVCSYSAIEQHLFILNSSGKGVCVCGRLAGNDDPIIINKEPEETS